MTASLAQPVLAEVLPDAADILAAVRARRMPVAWPTGFSESAHAFHSALPAALATPAAEVWRRLLEIPPVSGVVSQPGIYGSDPVTMLVPAADKSPVADESGLRISVATGERTRLVVNTEAVDDKPLWLHLALSLVMTGLESPVAAIRTFHGAGDEHLAARFREAGLVVGKACRTPLEFPSAPFLLTLGVKDGTLYAYLNGAPLYARPAPLRAATGFVIDFIGSTADPGGASVHALAVQQGGDVPFWLTPDDARLLVAADLAAGFALAPEMQEDALFARAAFPGVLDGDRTAQRIMHNRSARPYLPGLEQELLARTAVPVVPELGLPRPVVRVRDVVVSLNSNPGASHAFRWHSEPVPTVNVVNGVSFDAYAGDIIGILGRNGAGKSTFLKTLVGAMPLSSGRIDIDGKAVLLRPGAGMQPNLTGRENILKSGLHMDLTPEQIRTMTPGIVELAELGEHIDRPFKYYSDGMRSRLIFAMATAMPYDILLLDELLSAGDIGFQKRATERLDQVIRSAKVVFVVQHTFDFVLTRCTKCLVLEHGRPIFFGSPRVAAEMYREQVSG